MHTPASTDDRRDAPSEAAPTWIPQPGQTTSVGGAVSLRSGGVLGAEGPLGQQQRALEHLRRLGLALGVVEHDRQVVDRHRHARVVGAPNLAAMLNNLGNVHLMHDELDAAQAVLERALQIREASVGREHPTLASNLINLAGVAITRGDYAVAERRNTRALDLYERNFGPEHPEIAAAIENFALIHLARGELDAALAFATRALAIRERRLGPDHPERAISLHNLGDIRRARGELALAETSYTAALAACERTGSRADASVVEPLTGLGELALLRGQPARAAELLARAVAVGEATEVPARTLAAARFGLARALHASEPARARGLALQAAAGIVGADARATAQRAEIDAWLGTTAAAP